MVKATKKKSRSNDDDDEPSNTRELNIGEQVSHIRNKQARQEMLHKLKKTKKENKKKEREKRAKEIARAVESGAEPPPKQVPRTIESVRVKDITMVEADDEEVAVDEASDEFAAHFRGEVTPKILLTTSYHPSAQMFAFLKEMMRIFPNAYYYKRGGYEVKQIVGYANNHEFTHLVILNENRKKINGLLIVYLPEGPTAHFRVSNMVLSRDIKGHGNPTQHRPELILTNFATRVGHRVGRLLASLWPFDPQFRGRRVVTMHNQRDFIFFRQHRYIFEQLLDGKKRGVHKGHLATAEDAPRAPKEEKRRLKKEARKKKKGQAAEGEDEEDMAVTARLQELGPRFTLRLQSLQRGTFDSKHGEFEWVRTTRTRATRTRFAM